MVGFFAQRTQRTVRGEFARLLQMASLLSLERAHEVLDYWGGESAAHISWRLTPSEVRLVLSRRLDFSPADIAQLHL
jgi:Conserved oligomeric Golgi complex subunit 4, C-terminal